MIAALTLTLCLSGCANMDGTQGQTDSLQKAHADDTDSFQGQTTMINIGLPVKKMTITSGKNKHELTVEIASTDVTRKIGLMNRRSMDQDKGMLFKFDTQGYVYFWMKNTLFPLDMVFIDQNGIVKHVAHGAKPCTAVNDADCPKIPSTAPVKYVLEINSGVADKLPIKNGDQITWN